MSFSHIASAALLLVVVGVLQASAQEADALAPVPPVIDCRLVLCAFPDCPEPIQPPPGECCLRCPDDDLVCPPLDPDVFGICVNLCSSDEDCKSSQRCCSNGCGRVCTPGVPPTTLPTLPTPTPGVCKSGGVIYQVGESFLADDGCNICSCIAPGRIVCTLRACPPPTCTFGGVVYDVGDTFPAGDGCNRCTCSEGGLVACTEKACLPTCPPDKPLVNCFANPCDVTSCPAHPTARCEADFCGGCFANYFDEEGNDVTASCSTCPPDKPLVNCFANPCDVTSCPAHPTARCEADFCGGCFANYFDEEGNDVTASCSCPVRGQLTTDCGSACPANCTTPNPICTDQCVVRCECPSGTVINEATNSCVPTSDCPKPECPPKCTAAFCRKNRKALCSRPGPREIPGCTGSCQLTYCSACYFSPEPLPLPGSCRTCGAPVSSLECLRRWACCVRRAHVWANGRGYSGSEEDFKCYPYPCPLRG